jgi:hypothetical protein
MRAPKISMMIGRLQSRLARLEMKPFPQKNRRLARTGKVIWVLLSNETELAINITQEAVRLDAEPPDACALARSRSEHEKRRRRSKSGGVRT